MLYENYENTFIKESSNKIKNLKFQKDKHLGLKHKHPKGSIKDSQKTQV